MLNFCYYSIYRIGSGMKWVSAISVSTLMLTPFVLRSRRDNVGQDFNLIDPRSTTKERFLKNSDLVLNVFQRVTLRNTQVHWVTDSGGRASLQERNPGLLIEPKTLVTPLSKAQPEKLYKLMKSKKFLIALAPKCGECTRPDVVALLQQADVLLYGSSESPPSCARRSQVTGVIDDSDILGHQMLQLRPALLAVEGGQVVDVQTL